MAKKRLSPGEEAFMFQCVALKLPCPEREYRFHETRRWRFDFAWPELMVAVECEGGIHVQGRHSRGKSMESDMTKYNAATELGWRVFRYSTDMITSGTAIDQIEGFLASERQKIARRSARGDEPPAN